MDALVREWRHPQVRRARVTLIGLGLWMAVIAGGLSFGILSAALREDGVVWQATLLVLALWTGVLLLLWELGWRSATYRLAIGPDGTVRAGTPLRRRAVVVGPSDRITVQQRRLWLSPTSRRWVQDLSVAPVTGGATFRSRLPGGDIVPHLQEADVRTLVRLLTPQPIGAQRLPAAKPTEARASIGRLAGLIRDEMRRLGLWVDGASSIDPTSVTAAFGIGQMSFPQWLQGVFVPALEEVAAGRRSMPGNSQVGVMAFRALPGKQLAHLRDLLAEVDRIVRAHDAPV